MRKLLRAAPARLQKPPTEGELSAAIAQVWSEAVPGLTVELAPSVQAATLDGILKVRWHGRRQRFAYEYRISSTPRSVQGACAQVQRYSPALRARPLVIVPHLSDSSMRLLVEQQISGLDLCGNAYLLSDDFCVWRSGNANRFKESRPIQNVFAGDSSVFARCFALQPVFSSLTALWQFALERMEPGGRVDGGLLLGTASKVVRVLQDQLIVSRENKQLRLLDRDRLLRALERAYRPPSGRRVRGKAAHLPALFDKHQDDVPLRRVLTGAASAAHYGVLSAPDVLSVYVSDLERAVRIIGFEATDVFPTVELVEQPSLAAYFDARRSGRRVWASPLQTWLELEQGGPRERDAAATLLETLSAPKERKG